MVGMFHDYISFRSYFYHLKRLVNPKILNNQGRAPLPLFQEVYV